MITGIFIGWLTLCISGALLLKGFRLTRWCAFALAWQLTTPVREPNIDGALLITAFALTEIIYFYSKGLAKYYE